MIDRYCLPEMKSLWELESKFQSWLDVEIAVCEAQAELGRIPADAVDKIRANASFTVERILEIEAEVRHDLIAFVKAVTENMGDEAAYVHMGVTSYDIEDTALGLRLRRACDLLLADMDALEAAIAARAREHRRTLMIGRTHGIHAEPTTFGLKLCVWIEELRRCRRRLQQARQVVSAGKISGAVGTFANIDPRVEEIVCRRLGLEPANVSTQILQRDRHAEYMAALAITAGCIEKWATEIRNLQRTDLLEVEESFARGQRGSSAMPHKRNPIRCEQLCGLSRVVRANLAVSLDNIVTWHERDLCNSAPERVVLADSSILADYLLQRFRDVVEGLTVYPENMLCNLDKTRGLIFSQQVMLALIDKGWVREEAYKAVQRNALAAWNGNESFRELLERDAEVTAALSADDLDACFDPERHLQHVDYIFDRVGV